MGPAFSEFVTLHSEPHLEAQFGFEARFRFECRVDPGESVRTSPLLALKGPQGTDLMDADGDGTSSWSASRPAPPWWDGIAGTSTAAPLRDRRWTRPWMRRASGLATR